MGLRFSAPQLLQRLDAQGRALLRQDTTPTSAQTLKPPPPSYELGLNALLHVLILFTALTVLFAYVVSKTESSAINREFEAAVREALPPALEAAQVASRGTLRAALKPTIPAIEFAQNVAQGEDPASKVYNQGLMRNAYMVIGMLLAVLVTSLLTLQFVGKIAVGPTLSFVLVGNLVLFAVVGAVEFSFFELVALKFIPVKPSQITSNIIQDIKDAFTPKATAVF